MNHPQAGVIVIVIGAAVLIVTCAYALYDNWQKVKVQAKRLGTPQIILLIGIVGTWLFMTIALSATSWIVWNGGGASGTSQKDEGPLLWFTNTAMEGGPIVGRNVFSLTFRGLNASQSEVQLKDANIISAVNGSKIELEVVAEKELVPVGDIKLIPPGAAIELVAKFGPPDPNAPGKILGLEPKEFLETWRKFFFNAIDDTRKYRVPYNEGNIAVFFPGMVGPHVSKKDKKP